MEQRDIGPEDLGGAALPSEPVGRQNSIRRLPDYTYLHTLEELADTAFPNATHLFDQGLELLIGVTPTFLSPAANRPN